MRAGGLFRDAPIKWKLSVIMMLTACAALFFAVVAFATYDIRSIRQKSVKDLQVLARVMGRAAYPSLVVEDAAGVEDALRPILESRDAHVRYAAIIDANGQRLASFGQQYASQCNLCVTAKGPRPPSGYSF